jgi:hypothetical protein
MTWGIAWSAVAERDLRSMPWRLAARVDAAVMAFAGGEPTEATLERVSATDPNRVRLRFTFASALLWLDTHQRVVYVARVLQNR